VDEDLDEPESKSQDQGEPLTSDAITAKIAELKDVKKDGRRQRLDVEAKLKDIRKRISEIDAAETKIQDEMNALCIAGRNSYSRQAIKDDYAAGIKELDQELAEEADSANLYVAIVFYLQSLVPEG
jgi:septal ring factor EnvC (AmiA/AmiB activator)